MIHEFNFQLCLFLSIFIKIDKEYSIMKCGNIYKNSSVKKKNIPRMDKLPIFHNNIRNSNQSQGQSPFASFRMSSKNGSMLIRNRYQSNDDGKKSVQLSNKKKLLENSNQKQNKIISNKFRVGHNFSSCTLTPKNFQTQGNQQLSSLNLNRSNFKFMYQIGFGGFGKVWKVQQKISWQYYAMKQIQKRKVLDKDSVQCIINERKVLSQLNHNFLVNMKWSFQDKSCLYLIMDYLKGADLRYHICYRDNFNQIQTKFILACVITALEEIHSKGIVHRDIKPQNLVLQETGYVRLTDFGIAKYVQDIKIGKYDSSGTPGYMAPQILMKQTYNQVSDFFSLGVVGYELILNKRPYVGRNRQQIKQKISNQQTKITQKQLPQMWSKQSADFINKLLKKNPHERLGSKQGIKQLKQHVWMRDISWKKLYKKQILPPFIPNIVCETKQYLEQIQNYNQMNQEQNKKISRPLTTAEDKLFEGYGGKSSMNSFVQPLRNFRNTQQKNSKICTKSKKMLKVF